MGDEESGKVLGGSVLVLNRGYVAVQVITVRRAFILLYRELAEVVHIEQGRFTGYDFASWCELSHWIEQESRADVSIVSPIAESERRAAESPLPADSADDPVDDWVRTVSFSILVPRVVRLLGYDRVPRSTLRFNRRTLFARDGHRCQYCGQSRPNHQMSIDHVLPRSRGGETIWENVVCSCVPCNTKKGNRTPQEARMRLLHPPHRPSVNPLFASKLSHPKYAAWKVFLPTETRTHAGRSSHAADR